MEGVEEVKRLDNKNLHWKAAIGKTKKWEATITEQIPDEKIAWHSISGPENGGAVFFHPLSESSSKVTLHLSYEPDGIAETAGDALGFVSRQAAADLERFGQFIEDRRSATGAWRGEIKGDGI